MVPGVHPASTKNPNACRKIAASPISSEWKHWVRVKKS